ncbi:MAG TPA: hypothetical protein VMW41_04190 [Candidatus Bathyarchaeia archaeon]|nr:hypothetical protein [Candidatus Bathyarchaeia archaeon]
MHPERLRFFERPLKQPVVFSANGGSELFRWLDYNSDSPTLKPVFLFEPRGRRLTNQHREQLVTGLIRQDFLPLYNLLCNPYVERQGPEITRSFVELVRTAQRLDALGCGIRLPPQIRVYSYVGQTLPNGTGPQLIYQEWTPIPAPQNLFIAGEQELTFNIPRDVFQEEQLKN